MLTHKMTYANIDADKNKKKGGRIMIILNYDKKFKIVTDYFKIGALSL